jgi:hypothetical protein
MKTTTLPSLALAAIVIDKTLTVNIYQVCNDDGVSACASDGSSLGDQYFAAKCIRYARG